MIGFYLCLFVFRKELQGKLEIGSSCNVLLKQDIFENESRQGDAALRQRWTETCGLRKEIKYGIIAFFLVIFEMVWGEY